MTTTTTEQEVIQKLKEKPLKTAELVSELKTATRSEDSVRNAVWELLDRGALMVGTDWKLQPVE
jgi:hypothetical protein